MITVLLKALYSHASLFVGINLNSLTVRLEVCSGYLARSCDPKVKTLLGRLKVPLCIGFEAER